VEALARVHAAWWETPGRGVVQSHSTQSLTSMIDGIRSRLPHFLEAIGETISSDARRTLEKVFASSLKPWLRLTDARALTVTHGDAHAWNFLFERTGSGPAILIDWQLWHTDVGARDLAFLMALHWYPELRHEVEQPLLRHYHDTLRALGMTGYSFQDLMLDYRRCVVRNLTVPIVFWNRGMQPEYWFHRLECALAAYRDLACDELL
jgi:hypothetical protein